MHPIAKAFATLAFAALANPAAAHEIWLEPDGAGAVRVLLGEPAQAQPPGGDPEFHRLKTPVVFVGETRNPAPLERRGDHIRASVPAGGDVRASDAGVFDPWRTAAGAYEAATFYARLGRSETRAVLDLELAPTAPGADTFRILFKGAPLAGASVQVIDPELWTKTLKADASGQVKAPVGKRGRYILSVSHPEAGTFAIGGQSVTKLHHVATLTFDNP